VDEDYEYEYQFMDVIPLHISRHTNLSSHWRLSAVIRELINVISHTISTTSSELEPGSASLRVFMKSEKELLAII
jgi:hypothetical protein